MTKEFYETLRPCSVYEYTGQWSNDWRFVRRGKRWVVVAYITAVGHVYTAKRIHYNVAIAGRRLAYGRRQPNPLQPEPLEDQPTV